jgi:hypothetical protein
MKKKVLPLAVLAALAATPSLAATVVVTDTINSSDTSVSFAQFNTSLGTLDSVTLSFDADLSAAGSLKNTSANAVSTVLPESASAGLKGVDGFDLTTTLVSGSQKFDVPKKSTINFDITGSGSGSQQVSTGLSDFEGPGDVTFDFLRNTSFKDPGNPHLTIDPLITGDATLTYNYTQVATVTAAPPAPEPATWALLGVGVFGLGGAMRRRRDANMVAAAA